MVDLAARRTREAARAGADAQTLATVAGSVLRGARPLTALLERLRETFGLTSVTLLERVPDAGGGPDRQQDPACWRIAATVGEPPCCTPGEGDTDVPVDDDLALVLRGRPLPAADRRIVEAFAAQAAVALRQERLAEEAATAPARWPRPTGCAPRCSPRSATTCAPRSPRPRPRWPACAAPMSTSPTTTATELLATADESLDRLDRLVANLLDMSRLQAGALGVAATTVGVEDAVPAALDDLGDPGRKVIVRIPDDLPAVTADPGLLERVLVNSSATRCGYSPADRPPMITASEHAGRVELRVIDHGPGIPDDQRDQVFLPFQRLGDRDNNTGVGLGLALSRGLAEAMGGTLPRRRPPAAASPWSSPCPPTQPTVAVSEEQATILADRAIVERIHHRPRTHEGTP